MFCCTGFPCKVVEVTTSKTGKHGHAKANITGLDIFTNKKYQDISPTSHNMVAPFVHNSTFSLTDVNPEGYTSLMDDNGEMREDLKIPEGELGDKIKTLFQEDKEVNVIVTKAMETECITSYKISTEQ